MQAVQITLTDKGIQEFKQGHGVGEKANLEGSHLTLERVIDYTEGPAGTLRCVTNPRTYIFGPGSWVTAVAAETATELRPLQRT